MHANDAIDLLLVQVLLASHVRVTSVSSDRTPSSNAGSDQTPNLDCCILDRIVINVGLSKFHSFSGRSWGDVLVGIFTFFWIESSNGKDKIFHELADDEPTLDPVSV
jgi:hypothetical protein